MTKKQVRTLAFLVSGTIALTCFYHIDKDMLEVTRTPRPEKITSGSKSVVSRKPASLPSTPQKVVGIQTKSGLSHPVWQERLESTLKTQGGKYISKIHIETVDTFDWKIGKVDVKVNSILIKLENVNGQRSSFRAIVDATSGKILQTWDPPIIDNFSAKASGDIKVDPRYHNE